MRRVMAQGTFDILHPGHLHYLRESAALGEELAVVIARDSRIRDRKDIFLDEASRRAVVAALAMVDEARLGDEDSIFESVAALNPDVITLGYDQGYKVDDLKADLAAAGFEDVDVVRIGPYDGPGITSSSDVKRRIRERIGDDSFESVVDENQD